MKLAGKPRTYKRARNQFRAVLIYEMNRRGAQLKHDVEYRLLLETIQRMLPPVRQ